MTETECENTEGSTSGVEAHFGVIKTWITTFVQKYKC